MPGKNNRWWLLFISLALFGCGPSAPEPLETTIPADSVFGANEMVLILADLHLMESGLQLMRNRGEKTDSIEPAWRNGILHKYRMSSQRFHTNLEYYRKDPDRFIVLYERVVKRLDAMGAGMPDPRKREEN